MLSFLPVVIIFPLAFCAFVLNLTLWGFIVTSCGVLKLLPFSLTRRIASHVAHRAYRQWSVGNKAIMLLFNDVQFQVSPLPELSEQRWYLLIANHQSWLDIPVLTQFALNRVPEPKFFLKEELKWVPFIGSASWALDMPFMRRYSAQQIARNPALKGQDIETTRRSCEKFRHTPTTIINFVEGTRFTREKHQQKQSPFQHLLPPKAGGIAFTLASMGSQFDAVMDVTVVYPDNPRFVALAMLCGRLKRVLVNVELLPVDQRIMGEYFSDEAFRQQFQLWLNQRWQHKDQLIQHMLLQAQPQVPVRTWLDRHFSGS